MTDRCISLKACATCGIVYLLQKDTCKICHTPHKLENYDFPVREVEWYD